MHQLGLAGQIILVLFVASQNAARILVQVAFVFAESYSGPHLVSRHQFVVHASFCMERLVFAFAG